MADSRGSGDSFHELTVVADARPANLLPRLGPLYFRRLERITLGLIRVREPHDGIRFELRGTGLALLSFAPARFSDDEACYPIIGGLLTATPGGTLALGTRQQRADLHLWMEVRNYRPRLPRWLYRLTQTWLHDWIARDYLRQVQRTVKRYSSVG